MELILMYSLMVYGLTVLLVEGFGPFHIIEKFRNFMSGLSPMFGEMFECFLCTSTNIGWFVVLAEQLFGFTISPVSVWLGDENVIVDIFCNMFFTCGVVWILRNAVTLLEKKIDAFDNE